MLTCIWGVPFLTPLAHRSSLKLLIFRSSSTLSCCSAGAIRLRRTGSPTKQWGVHGYNCAAFLVKCMCVFTYACLKNASLIVKKHGNLLPTMKATWNSYHSILRKNHSKFDSPVAQSIDHNSQLLHSRSSITTSSSRELAT